jgi:DNA polymerase III subunit delta'
VTGTAKADPAGADRQAGAGPLAGVDRLTVSDGRPDRGRASANGPMRTRGHDRAVASIRGMVAGRVPHAILISGPAGIGKTTLALDLAAGLLCDDPDPLARPCRACRGCRLVERGRHPDVHRLAPSGPGDQIRIGTRDRPEDGTVRRLASDLVLMSVEGGPRIAIVERADRLTDDAQTALLKTLEEPPAGVTIVLCADDEDRLLPTVRSRAARIRLGPVAVREIELILGDAGVAEPPLAARLARIAAGRPGAARTLARAPDALAARDEIARSLLDLLAAGPALRLAAVRDLTARATDVARALDRATLAADDAENGAGGEPAKRGRTKAKGPAATRAGTVAPPAPIPGDDDDERDAAEEPGAGKTAVPAAERRRAAAILVGLWRELARDLLLVALGEERQVRDPGLLDDLRVAAANLDLAAERAPSSERAPDRAAGPAPDPVLVRSPDPAAGLGGFLGRLDAAGELLEANVRPELVLDTLLLHWPRAAR